MLNNWLYIGIFFIIALALPGVAIFLAGVLGPKKSNAEKRATYECGIETVGETQIQFHAQYYIFALIFLIFDVEAVFLFPWAAAYGQMSFYAVLEGLIFILVLMGGLAYVWKKGVLEWK